MKRKIFVLLASLMIIGGTSLFATTGIGVQGGYGVGGDNGASLTFKTEKSPLVFAVDGYIGSSSMAFGATADLWFGNPKIAGSFGFFYGLGANGAFVMGNDYGNIRVGGRVVGGLNLFLLDGFLEFYAQAAWNPYFEFAAYGEGGRIGAKFDYFPINAGLRFWF